jgi:hypothetical protein|tara:strand:- start:217 stop:651 length:435 start_codon:yes stop_codon:yes gene_type:complete
MSGEEAYTQLKVQQYLDDVSRLDISPDQTQWYNVDVASILSGTRILGHEVDESSGSSLLFLERSVMLCCPESGRMHHFPKHLLHCFVDDNRSKCDAPDGVLLRAELFSITPEGEQLTWERCCRSEMEVPEVQGAVARWLSWLNA